MAAKAAVPQYSRPGLVPGLIGVLTMMFGIAGLGTDWWTVVLYLASIFALIQLVFSWQAKQWWWIPFLLAIAVLWNPVYPITLPELQTWPGLHIAAALVFAISGWLIKIQLTDDKQTKPRR